MAVNRNFIDMSHGPLFGKIVRYALPLMLTYLLQLAFHAADMVVIGRWGSSESLAAIGATGAITALIINVITGLSTGANILAAQYFGAKDSKNMTRLVHTAISVSLVGGVAAALVGFAAVKWLVDITDIPEASQSKSILYLVICFIGVPFQIIYNFGSAILRAVGNTKSPLYYLTTAGAVNVILNIFLVVICKLDVAGVAIATVISQALSARLVTRRLQRNHGATRLIWRNLRIELAPLKKILRLGLPAGLQSGCFSISNLVVQSGINSFGVAAVAGITAGHNIELLLYAFVYSMHHTAIAVVGQNYGAKQYHRLIKAIYLCVGLMFAINIITGYTLLYFSPQMVGIFSSDPEVIRFGVIRAQEMFTVYFLLGFMDVTSGAARGLGATLIPAIATLAGTCGLRVLWVRFALKHYDTVESILWSYPISWVGVTICNIILLVYLCRKLLRCGSLDNRSIQLHR